MCPAPPHRRGIPEPDAILQTTPPKAETVEKIVHDSGPLPIWPGPELAKHDAPVVCIDARRLQGAIGTEEQQRIQSIIFRPNDRSDAEALAQQGAA